MLAVFVLSVATLAQVESQSSFSAQGPKSLKPFSVAVIADPQKYADMKTNLVYQDRWRQQAQWIVDTRDVFNTVFVTVVGDLVQNFGQYSAEWAVARSSVNLFHVDGDPQKPTRIPFGYSLSIGNHDFDQKQWTGYHPQTGAITNKVLGTTRWRANFGPAWFQSGGFDWWGGSDVEFSYSGSINGVDSVWPGEGLNTYQWFEGGGRRFLHLSLELGVPDYAIAWARTVLAANPGVPTILSTHSLISGSGAFVDEYKMWREDVGNSGQAVWDKLIAPHDQIFLVLCGHTGVQRNVTLQNEVGRDVHILLTAYTVKKLPEDATVNGAGWLRLLEFDPVAESIRGRTYSPTIGDWAPNAGMEPLVAYPAPGGGDALNGTLSDFTIRFDWDERF